MRINQIIDQSPLLKPQFKKLNLTHLGSWVAKDNENTFKKIDRFPLAETSL